jgi:hypothetical protein
MPNAEHLLHGPGRTALPRSALTLGDEAQAPGRIGVADEGSPFGRQCMTRGQCGWLDLHCMKLTFTTRCRFDRAHGEIRDYV